MNREHSWSSAPVLFLVVLFLFAGCDSSTKEISGKWRSTGSQTFMEWEFAANGRVIMDNTPAHYKRDGERIKIQTPSATFVYQIEIMGDRMALKDITGTKMEFIRVEPSNLK